MIGTDVNGHSATSSGNGTLDVNVATS
jgi:hypothetical protein